MSGLISSFADETELGEDLGALELERLRLHRRRRPRRVTRGVTHLRVYDDNGMRAACGTSAPSKSIVRFGAPEVHARMLRGEGTEITCRRCLPAAAAAVLGLVLRCVSQWPEWRA